MGFLPFPHTSSQTELTFLHIMQESFLQPPANSINDDAAPPSATVCSILCSPFCLLQLLFNITASFAGPLACFWLIFSSMGPEVWDGGPMLSVVIASPWACALAANAFIPIGIPDAFAYGWFAVVPTERLSCTLCLFPFLHCRLGVIRHLCLGCYAAILWIPAVGLLARYVEGPEMSADTFVFFGPACIAALPVLVVPLGLLGFALPANYARVEAKMTTAPGVGPLEKTIRRAILAPTC